jgi:hypothetical protein
MVAKSVEDLHSENANITKETALTEKGEMVSGRGDAVNMHDILTGSDPMGMYSTAGGDTTCGNWTKISPEKLATALRPACGRANKVRHLATRSQTRPSPIVRHTRSRP